MMQTVTEPGGTATQARDPGLPRRRQDRHRAQVQRRRLFGQVRRVFRRRGAGRQSAFRDGGGGQRSRPARSTYGGLVAGTGVQERHGRRAAADGRAAGRHRDLAGGAGRGRGQAERRPAAWRQSGGRNVDAERQRRHAARSRSGRCAMNRRMAVRTAAGRCRYPADLVITGLAGQPRYQARRRVRRDRRLRRAWTEFRRTGPRRWRQRDPVRAAGAGRHPSRPPTRSRSRTCVRAWANWPIVSMAASFGR